MQASAATAGRRPRREKNVDTDIGDGPNWAGPGREQGTERDGTGRWRAADACWRRRRSLGASSIDHHYHREKINDGIMRATPASAACQLATETNSIRLHAV